MAPTHYPDWLADMPPDIKASAFRRGDIYGTYANNPLPFAAKLRLVLLAIFLVPLKVLLTFICVIGYYICILLGNSLSGLRRTKYMAATGKFWTRCLLYAMGFFSIRWLYVTPDGKRSATRPPGFADTRIGGYVSTHCSWADIILYMSQIFPSFVAKKEVSDLPLIGTISKAMQCLFVDREARLAAAGKGGEGMSQLVKERMQRRFASPNDDPELPMLLFPEGTTTNNSAIMPFKRGAFVAGVPVQPLVLQYDKSGPFWPTWDAMPGFTHIGLLLSEPSHRVTVLVLPPYVPSEAEKADPTLYAENVRQLMIKCSGIPATDETFADKLAFFKYVTGRIAAQKAKPKAE
ncbi:hypothetical protein HYH03_010356 [Edaphochlamys debaryana]|uniref:Phospholipid/glycerol acyltransferase domain-containing protein n=1 Tax=Edaphochlamys debaryana TaxID=47281 RepID=A0A835XUE8_9CHLO|nr:hypothetical protein HYH03_010356 [Edaphochlamys debaryana]|eukprot:KAG2491357.1 hypothetical protein HYH03_010356 [Edaphochlamys debaryana]